MQKDIAKVREVFDDFLAKYPLCYGYWMQYVAAEASHGDQADNVLERGVAATPYSIELWLHYIDRLRKGEASPDDIRKCASAHCTRSGGNARPCCGCHCCQLSQPEAAHCALLLRGGPHARCLSLRPPCAHAVQLAHDCAPHLSAWHVR